MGLSAVLAGFGELAKSTKTGFNRTKSSDIEEKNSENAPPNDAASHLDPFYKVVEQPIGARRPIRVACLGAGYSGLMMSIVFSQKMQNKNAEFVVYERNADLGGTWFENR